MLNVIDKVSCIQYNIDMVSYKIEYLITPTGKAPIVDWLNSLDNSTRKRITQRILRLEDGNFELAEFCHAAAGDGLELVLKHAAILPFQDDLAQLQ